MSSTLERFRFGLDIFNDLAAFGRALFDDFKGSAPAARDYLRGEIQATGDDGKPYMAVRTTRPDGEDLAVNAGLATLRGQS